jgi:triacylglycerol lipase
MEMAKKPTLRELQEVYFQDRTKFFAELSSSQQAFEAIMQRGSVKRAQMEKDMAAALAAVDQETQKEAEESKVRLSQLIPIDPNESPPPTLRAAYSDRMAALLAKLAFFAYVRFEVAGNMEILERVLKDGGMELKKTYNINNTEAYLAEHRDFVVVAFRGTSSKRDRATDFDFRTKKISIPGHPLPVNAHRGFYAAYKCIEADLRSDLQMLTDASKPIYFTGHSLGGALAIVATAAIGISDDPAEKDALEAIADRIAAVYSFGAPRVGDSNFDNIVKAPHYRVVNRFDLITLTPPNWLLGYRHTGDVRLLRAPGMGPLRRPSGSIMTALNLISSFFLSITGQMRMLERHHAITLYAAKLEEIARARSAWH